MEMPQTETQRKSKKFINTIGDEAERKRGEEVLDEALENTFPASDPVSAEQPVHAHQFENPPTTVTIKTTE
jgi:hypothetical protein